MEFIGNGKILNCVGELVSAKKAFKNNNLILFYFSASWCEPCKQLLPTLKKLYDDCHKEGKFQIIYISADDDRDEMLKYFKEKHSSGWFALPFDDPNNLVLRTVYGVTYIPTLIVVRISDGFVVSTTGLKDILELGRDAIIKWKTDEDD